MQLNESCLKRLRRHLLEHDTALISAMCNKTLCGLGNPISKKENRTRLAKLEQIAGSFGSHYSSTKVCGGVIEKESDTSKEGTLFIVDLKDSGKLKSDVMKWGLDFGQDSVIFIPAGSMSGLMIGTSKCDNATHALDAAVDIGAIKIGRVGIMFANFEGNHFVFEEKMPNKYAQGWISKMGIHTMSKLAPYYIS